MTNIYFRSKLLKEKELIQALIIITINNIKCNVIYEYIIYRISLNFIFYEAT